MGKLHASLPHQTNRSCSGEQSVPTKPVILMDLSATGWGPRSPLALWLDHIVSSVWDPATGILILLLVLNHLLTTLITTSRLQKNRFLELFHTGAAQVSRSMYYCRVNMNTLIFITWASTLTVVSYSTISSKLLDNHNPSPLTLNIHTLLAD